jgi:hypothetical protein
MGAIMLASAWFSLKTRAPGACCGLLSSRFTMLATCSISAAPPVMIRRLATGSGTILVEVT